MTIITAIIVLAKILDITGARFTFGSCPQNWLVPDFDPNRYSGIWYQIVRDKMNHIPFEF